jgi:hypothetical protein
MPSRREREEALIARLATIEPIGIEDQLAAALASAHKREDAIRDRIDYALEMHFMVPAAADNLRAILDGKGA